MLLDAKAILAARDRETREIEIPEWGGSILVGVMGALDGARLLDWLEDQTPLPPSGPSADEKDEPVTLVTCDSPGGEPERLTDEPEKAADSPGPKLYSRAVDTELMVRYLIATILDPATLLPAFTLADRDRLGSKHPAGLRRAYAAALEINGESKQAAADLEKNSPGAAVGSSGGA